MLGKHAGAVTHSPDTGTVEIVPGGHGVHVRPSPRCPWGQVLHTIGVLRAGQLVSLLYVHPHTSQRPFSAQRPSQPTIPNTTQW